VRDEAVLESIPAPSAPTAFPADWAECLPGLVDDVSPASRAVIVLHYLHDMTLEDVAEVLGVAMGTVKSRLAYGLARIRKSMSER
jgi:DNA-directed RNA polymerase specialized sigma24 family protein